MPFTLGFYVGPLLDHFSKHGAEFGAISPLDYQARADEFLGAPLPRGRQECVASNGDRIRFDPVTSEFGVLSSDRHIRTYYIMGYPTPNQARNALSFLRKCLE